MLSLVQAFQFRKSVRTFHPEFSQDLMNFVNQTIEEVNQIPSLFGNETKLFNHGPGLGWSSVFSGDAGWILGGIKTDVQPTNDQLIESGFKLQLAVMKLSQRSVGTIFVAGTFSQSTAESAISGYKVPLVVGYGQINERQGLVSRFFSWVSGSKTRKPINQLFFDETSQKVFDENSLGDREELIRCLQSAPSARNIQPWRYSIGNNCVHLFNSAPSTPYSFMDMGIGIASTYLLLSQNDKHAKITRENVSSTILGGTYICSISLDQ